MAEPIHLVLSAGGVRVISYVGAIDALELGGFEFASVSACSAGTLIGALVAAGRSGSDLEQRVLGTDLRKLEGKRRLLGVVSALLGGWPYSRYIESGVPQFFCDILQDDPTFEDLTVPFSTAGVDMLSGRLLVYSSETHPEMRVAEAIRIAVGVPFVYPPYETSGRVIVDAAIATQSPVWLAADRGDQLPIVVLRPRRKMTASAPKNLGDFMGAVIDSGVASRDHYLIRQIPRVRVVDIDCGDLQAFDFGRAEAEKKALIARGRDTCSEMLADFSSITDAVEEIPNQDASDEDRAEVEGYRRMVTFNSPRFWRSRDQVFISYAHDDREWLDKIQVHLKPHVRYGQLRVWADSEISAGTRWQPEIQNALEATKVAVLMVTPAFLASDFIADEELAYFLDASRNEGLKILWVPVSSSSWQATPIQQFQAAHDPDKPLDELDDADARRALVEICERIAAALEG